MTQLLICCMEILFLKLAATIFNSRSSEHPIYLIHSWISTLEWNTTPFKMVKLGDPLAKVRLKRELVEQKWKVKLRTLSWKSSIIHRTWCREELWTQLVPLIQTPYIQGHLWHHNGWLHWMVSPSATVLHYLFVFICDVALASFTHGCLTINSPHKGKAPWATSSLKWMWLTIFAQ